jgi:hypothetical protein
MASSFTCALVVRSGVRQRGQVELACSDGEGCKDHFKAAIEAVRRNERSLRRVDPESLNETPESWPSVRSWS